MKPAELSKLFKNNLDRFVLEVPRYCEIVNDQKWETIQGHHRSTVYQVGSKQYTIEKLNGELSSVSDFNNN